MDPEGPISERNSFVLSMRTGYSPCKNITGDTSFKMAKSVSLCFLSALVLVRGDDDSMNLGTSLSFPCFRAGGERTIPVFIDAEGSISDEATGSRRALQIYDSLVVNSALTTSSNLVSGSLTRSQEICVMMTRKGQVPIPITVFQGPSGAFAMTNVNPESAIFTGLHSIATSAIVGPDGSNENLELLVSANGHLADGSTCSGNIAQQMHPKVMEAAGTWTVEVENFALHNASSYAPVLNSSSGSPHAGRISTLTAGIILPSEAYDRFLGEFDTSPTGDALIVGDRIILKSCKATLRTDLVITLVGQNGFGIVLTADMYTQKLANNQCMVQVSRGRNAEFVLGAVLFQSGFVEFSRNGDMVVCPLHLYHPTDSAFQYGDNGDRLPKSLNHASAPGLLAKYSDDDEGGKILIGVTVAGIVVIIAVISWFVWRAKRKRRLLKRMDQFDPRRGMISDPSIASEASAQSPQQRVII